MIYTVGNEQDYHFNVLFKILKAWLRLGQLSISLKLWNGRFTVWKNEKQRRNCG
ncbi:MAG: hypothetical protein CM15mP102_20980 [Flavobacteriales bacterium]|nr:MAG: hypothetical protein CM15mP102_20980 [Flavobacteriales bacterium]